VVDVALHDCDFELEGARLVVQGFGAVGSHAARFLTAKGARLVAVADSRGAVHNPDGLDVNALLDLKAAGKSVAEYGDGTRLDSDAVIDVECDIWIPAARPDVVNENNVHRLRTRLVVEGANIPFTLAAEEYLHERGVLCIPDFIANAGGVICAAMEYHGATQQAALQSIEEKLRRNTGQVLETAKRKLILPRQAAIEMAEQRVRTAMGFRRFPSFSTAPDYT
jgi:glutamate dehydrogenase (NAD(P)+)